MLRLNAVSKRYGRGRWMLRDVDLEVAAGEVVAVGGMVSGRPDMVGYVPDRFPPNERSDHRLQRRPR